MPAASVAHPLETPPAYNKKAHCEIRERIARDAGWPATESLVEVGYNPDEGKNSKRLAIVSFGQLNPSFPCCFQRQTNGTLSARPDEFQTAFTDYHRAW